MENKIILALMQLKGISRKTIINRMSINTGCICDVETINDLLWKTKNHFSRMQEYSSLEIEQAIEDASRIIENCEKLNIKMLTYLDHEYPEKMKKTTDYPAVIYYKGDISCLSTMNSVAIVGTREPSEYGRRIAFKLGESFAKRGFVDVSGLAIGCDTGGHEGCIAGNGKTIAVLAGGLDKIYPAVNKGLAEEIVKTGGALLSEYPPYSAPFKSAFVDRDRIQAALSDGVMVIETREKGGTWHAVRFAGDYGRPVGCFKHPTKYEGIPQASGNRLMIHDGIAHPLENDTDLDNFCILLKKPNETIEKKKEEYNQLTIDQFFNTQED